MADERDCAKEVCSVTLKNTLWDDVTTRLNELSYGTNSEKDYFLIQLVMLSIKFQRKSGQEVIKLFPLQWEIILRATESSEIHPLIAEQITSLSQRESARAN